MIFLIILFFFLIYLAVSIGVVIGAAKWAKKRNRRPWLWGGLAALVMYNLVFWDWIPTLVAHKYYCSTQAGFWVYKTPEEWMKENPGVAETLKRSLDPYRLDSGLVTTFGDTRRSWLTQRFYADITWAVPVVFLTSMHIEKKQFYDAKTGELIAKSINYWRGASGNVISLGGTPNEVRKALLLGLGNRQCSVDGQSPTDDFDRYIYQFWKWGENK